MIRALRRILSGALTPPPVRSIPTDEQLADALKLVRVQSYTRKKPTNHKREALHAELRKAVGR